MDDKNKNSLQNSFQSGYQKGLSDGYRQGQELLKQHIHRLAASAVFFLFTNC